MRINKQQGANEETEDRILVLRRSGHGHLSGGHRTAISRTGHLLLCSELICGTVHGALQTD